MAETADEFGEAIRAVMSEQKLSSRDVERIASERGWRVSSDTVASMARGRVPHAEYILAFSVATGSDLDDLLWKAGKPFTIQIREANPALMTAVRRAGLILTGGAGRKKPLPNEFVGALA
jgi:hypothetical protein